MQDLHAVVVVLSVIAFVAGVGVVGRGWVQARARRRNAAGARWAIAALPEATWGTVAGAVTQTSCVAVAPLSGRACVWYRVRVSELRAWPGIASRHALVWDPIIDEQRGVEFLLDDGSGRVRIDPTDAAIELRAVQTRVTGADCPLNRHEEALLRRHGISPRDGLGKQRPLRFEEVAIELGQHVVAVGCGERDASISTTDLWGLRPASTALRMTAPRISDALAS